MQKEKRKKIKKDVREWKGQSEREGEKGKQYETAVHCRNVH